MTMKRLAKLAFSFALAAACLLGYLTLGSPTADAASNCPSVLCSGKYSATLEFCIYYEPSTECYFRCRRGTMRVGSSTVACAASCEWDFPL